jgi:hypothetical protein
MTFENEYEENTVEEMNHEEVKVWNNPLSIKTYIHHLI